MIPARRLEITKARRDTRQGGQVADGVVSGKLTILLHILTGDLL